MNKQLAIAASLSLVGVANASFVDDFNRADSTNMGPNWTEQSGDFQILGNRAELINAATSPSWMSVNGLTGAPISTVISIDAFQLSASVSYVALEMGILNGSQMLFSKLQDNNNDGLFDTVFFYYGNNGNGFTTIDAFNLVTPTASARITGYMSDADTIHMSVDNNFDSVVDEDFNVTGVSGLTLGSGVGAGLYGDAAMDNFSVNAVPEPASFAVLSVGALMLLRRRRK